MARIQASLRTQTAEALAEAVDCGRLQETVHEEQIHFEASKMSSRRLQTADALADAVKGGRLQEAVHEVKTHGEDSQLSSLRFQTADALADAVNCGRLQEAVHKVKTHGEEFDTIVRLEQDSNFEASLDHDSIHLPEVYIEIESAKNLEMDSLNMVDAVNQLGAQHAADDQALQEVVHRGAQSLSVTPYIKGFAFGPELPKGRLCGGAR